MDVEDIDGLEFFNRKTGQKVRESEKLESLGKKIIYKYRLTWKNDTPEYTIEYYCDDHKKRIAVWARKNVKNF